MDIRGKKIAIVGLGLLGTSLGLALRGKCNRFAWARRKESLDYALKIGACEQATDKIQDVLSDADISIICLPVKTIISFVRENRKFFKKNSIVTDIGSVKRRIVNELEPLLAEESVNFIGSHPMAGSEQSGAESSRQDIYQGALVFLTPTANLHTDVFDSVSSLWMAVGANILSVTPEEHDRIVAVSSHLVHISAAVLAKTVLATSDLDPGIVSQACAGGFRDSTRVAVSSPEMWEEIIEFNADNIIPKLRELENSLREIRNALDKRDFNLVSVFLKQSALLRGAWKKSSNK